MKFSIPGPTWQLSVLLDQDGTSKAKIPGIFPIGYSDYGHIQAKTALRQRVLDIERQSDINQCPNFLAVEDKKYAAEQATHLSFLEIPQHTRAFFLAR